MHINANTVLHGQTILLVPFGKHHVKKYHTWMENEEIRELTTSSRLTIDEVYDLQQTWLHDRNNCTFIILSKEIFNQTHDEIESMIGDVNLLINDSDDIHCGEIGIMIGESTARQKGYATETLDTFLRYTIEVLNITRFIVKITLRNLPSIGLFTKKLHFQTIEMSEISHEVTMERHVDENVIQLLHTKTPAYSIDYYDNLTEDKKA